MIRLANTGDIQAIYKTYEEMFEYERSHATYSSYQEGKYPTLGMIEEHVAKGEMYVLDEGGEIIASIALSEDQPERFDDIHWQIDVPKGEYVCARTLVVRASQSGKGYGTQMMEFAKDFAASNHKKALRLETDTINIPAVTLYTKTELRIVEVKNVMIPELEQEIRHAFMEYRVEHGEGLTLLPAYQRMYEVLTLMEQYRDNLICKDPEVESLLGDMQYEREMSNITNRYCLPDGRIYLALYNGRPAGFITMRRFDEESVEVKALYVKPKYRGHGLGGAMLDQVLRDAETMGYSRVLGTTMPFMKSAAHMYSERSFGATEDYSDDWNNVVAYEEQLFYQLQL